MADGALAIMESLRAGRIQPDNAVMLLIYEARWPVEAAERGVFGPRDMQAMQMPQPRPCGCEDEDAPPPEPGTIEDLIGALQQQVAVVEQEAADLKAEAAPEDPLLPHSDGPSRWSAGSPWPRPSEDPSGAAP